jgi:hypothetical protein
MKNIFVIISLVIFTANSISQSLNLNAEINAGKLAKEAYSTTSSTDFQHFIIYGQSLSTGHQSYPSLSVNNVAGNYMVGDQVWINAGNTNFSTFSPLIASLAKSDLTKPLSRNGGMAECPLVAAVNHIQTKAVVSSNILATSAGTGGMTIEQLSKESQQASKRYPDYLKTITNASLIAKSKGYKITCPTIIWMQGEYNYFEDTTRGLIAGQSNCTDKLTYKNLLLLLKNNMQADLMTTYSQTSKPLFITYQTGAQYTRGKTLEIGMAQLEIANENSDVFCAGPVYQMSDRGGHLDANGYRWYGEMIAKAYLKTINSGKKFQPLQPKEIARTSNPKEIKIKFSVPKLPLVLDILTLKRFADYGFAVYNNDSKQTISSVSIDNDCVRIICSADLTGNVEVVYAGLNTGNDNGHGNLRDSDDYPAINNYIDLDKKNTDGTYTYPRDATETTLHPIYEPSNQQGLIYDKPYPLYNFSVAFYYMLKSNQQIYTVPNVDNATGFGQSMKAGNTIQLYQSGKNLIVETLNEGNFNIEVYNVTGKLVDKFKGNTNGNIFRNQFSLSLSKGIYIVKATVADEFNTLKVLL